MHLCKNPLCAVALSVPLLFAACSSDERKPTVDLKAEAAKLDSLFMKAFNEGDANAMMELHWKSPELRAFTPGEMEVRGWEGVKASYEKDFAMSKGGKLTITDENSIHLTDAVIGYGTFNWTMPVDSGAPMSIDGRYTEVKAVKDGKLVIVLDHTSVPMMPPTEPDTIKAQ